MPNPHQALTCVSSNYLVGSRPRRVGRFAGYSALRRARAEIGQLPVTCEAEGPHPFVTQAVDPKAGVPEGCNGVRLNWLALGFLPELRPGEPPRRRMRHAVPGSPHGVVGETEVV